MTFLYDEKILEEFEKVLQPKIAQVAPQQQVFTPAQMQDVALKLLGNIKTSYSPIEVQNNAQLFSKNTFSLNALIEWLLTNKVKYNGHQIISNDKFNLDKSIEYVNYVPGGANTFVWKDGIVNFLKDLKQQADSSNNAYFSEHVSGLIADANKELQAGLDESKAKPVEETKEPQQAQQPATQLGGTLNQEHQGTEQNVIQKAVYTTQETLKQRTGSDSIDLPFDTETNDVNIRSIDNFTRQVSFSFQTAIAQNKWGIIESQIQQISNAITRWNGVATPTAREGGFQLNINTNVDSFVNTYADSDYAKARAMLNSLIPLLQGIHNLLNTLLASPVFVELLGGSGNITNQTSRAQEMIASAQHWISRIEDVLKDNARR